MRALWSQIPRPRLGSPPSLSINDPAATILVRKTTTAPFRRRLTFNDAFTLLLTPVFATAFVVDTSWKEKQRKDWDRKFAEIQDEIDQYHAREQRVRSSLRAQSVSGGLLLQRRYYSASTSPDTSGEQGHSEANEDEKDEIEPPYFLVDNLSDLENNMSLENPQSTIPSQPSTSEQLSPSDPDSATQYSNRELSAAHRYHRLIATMLAVRLITHFHVATSARYIPEEDDGMIADTGSTKQFADIKDIPWLVEMNRKLRAELRSLKLAYPDLQRLGNRINKFYRGSSLNMDIVALVEDFKKQKLDPFEFVQGYARLILHSDEVPCAQTYLSILQAVGRAGHHSLANYVTSALKHSTLPLTDQAVCQMLLLFGRNRDAMQFENFLRRVIQSGSPHNVVGKWQMYKSKNGSIPVPENLNPRILQLLVYMALRCNQPDRAEIWSSFLEEVKFDSVNVSYLFSSFLQHYALLTHWDAGILWLRKSVLHANLIASSSMTELSRVIFRMLDLCVACGRVPEYTTILDATIKAHIHPPEVLDHQRQKYTPRARSILLEWGSSAIPTDEHGLPSIRRRALKFQEMCRLPESGTSPIPSGTHQAPEDDLLTMAPATNPTEYLPQSTPRQAPSEVTRSQLSDVESQISAHQAQIGSLTGQIKLARQAIHPLQQDLYWTQKRELEQKELIERLQNQLTNSQTALDRLDRLYGEQKTRVEEHARLATQMESLPATLSSLKSMQTEIAVLKAGLENFQNSRPTSAEKPKNRQALAKQQSLPDPTPIRKHMAIVPGRVSKKCRPGQRVRQERAQIASSGNFRLTYVFGDVPDPVEVPGKHSLIWVKAPGKQSNHDEPPKPNLQQTDEAGHVRTQGGANLPNIESSQGNSLNSPDINLNGAETAKDTPVVHYEVQGLPKAQRGRVHRPGQKYRLDLSNIGHAIPEVENWTHPKKVGEDARDNHVVIRPYYY